MSTETKPIDKTKTSNAKKPLSRREVAQIFGCDKRSIQRLDGRVLHPKRDRKTNRLWYDPDEVARGLAARHPAGDQAASQEPASQKAALQSTGRVASQLFVAFKQGKSVVDVVIEQALDPATVKALHRDWLANTDNIFIEGANLARLRRSIPGIRSVVSLIETIEILADAYHELKRFGYECPACGERIQAKSDREWQAIIEANVLHGWLCDKCMG